MSNLHSLNRPSSAGGSGWRRSAAAITLFLTAVAAAIAVVFLTTTQITERNTAQRFLAVAAASLLEIDQFVANAWPALEIAAAEDNPIPLTGFAVGLQLDPDGVADGPAALAKEVAAATASLIYDGGLDVLSDAPQSFRLVSRGAAFDGTIGRLTRGGHDIATLALVVSGSLTILLVLAVASQTRGLSRFAAPAIAIGFGVALVWLTAMLLQSSFEARAEQSLDPFSADLWWIAADSLGMLMRNAAVVGLGAAFVAAAALVAGALLRAVEQRSAPGLGQVR